MQIDRLIYPVKTLGPGNRMVIWTIGCPHRCFNCSNRELWNENLQKEVDVKKLIKTVKNAFDNNIVDGITITGGEPFFQKDLQTFLLGIKSFCNDILVYTGYCIKDVSTKNIDVLIDGKYIDDMNDNKAPLRGSTNQNINYITKKHIKKYNEYLKKQRNVQNLFYEGNLISVGIPNKLKEG